MCHSQVEKFVVLPTDFNLSSRKKMCVLLYFMLPINIHFSISFLFSITFNYIFFTIHQSSIFCLNMKSIFGILELWFREVRIFIILYITKLEKCCRVCSRKSEDSSLLLNISNKESELLRSAIVVWLYNPRNLTKKNFKWSRTHLLAPTFWHYDFSDN